MRLMRTCCGDCGVRRDAAIAGNVISDESFDGGIFEMLVVVVGFVVLVGRMLRLKRSDRINSGYNLSPAMTLAFLCRYRGSSCVDFSSFAKLDLRRMAKCVAELEFEPEFETDMIIILKAFLCLRFFLIELSETSLLNINFIKPHRFKTNLLESI